MSTIISNYMVKEAERLVFACKEHILFEVVRLTDMTICAGEARRRMGRERARQFCDSS